MINKVVARGILLPDDSNLNPITSTMVSKSIYTRIYDNLVEKGKALKEQWEPVGSGLERHHIIPRHQGGTDDESNFAYLTRREHIIAHFLLWKINGHDGDRTAYKMMKGVTCYPSRLGAKHTEETKQRMSELHKKRYEDLEYRASMKKRYEDPEYRAKQSKSKKKYWSDPAKRAKQSKSQKKRYEDLAERAKISEAVKKRYEDPAERAKTAEANRKRYEDPAERAKMSEAAKKGWAKRRAKENI